MRTPRTEIERILGAASERFNQKKQGHDLGSVTLMDHAYFPMFRKPEKAREVIAGWCRESMQNSAVTPTYLGCEYLVCAHCVMANQFYDEGKINESWVHAMDAQTFSGMALAQSVAVLQVDHAISGGSRKGGMSKKSEKTKVFACGLFDGGGYTDPNKARDELFEQVTQQAALDGWRMAATGGRTTLRGWFIEHLKTKRQPVGDVSTG
jgi:hypothetical protein